MPNQVEPHTKVTNTNITRANAATGTGIGIPGGATTRANASNPATGTTTPKLATVSALCPVKITWKDDTAEFTVVTMDKLVAVGPLTGSPVNIVPRHMGKWGAPITADIWSEESQLIAEQHLIDMVPLRLTYSGARKLLNWMPSVLSRNTQEDGSVHFDLMLTCTSKGKHFGVTMTATLHIGWSTEQCATFTGMYELARETASIHRKIASPEWHKNEFIYRSAMRVARNAQKRLPNPITWAAANAALNSRSRLLATQYGIDDIRSEALKQAELKGFIKLVKGKHGPGSKWLRTDTPLPSNAKTPTRRSTKTRSSKASKASKRASVSSVSRGASTTKSASTTKGRRKPGRKKSNRPSSTSPST